MKCVNRKISKRKHARLEVGKVFEIHGELFMVTQWEIKHNHSTCQVELLRQYRPKT